jgi:hypothetical protein
MELITGQRQVCMCPMSTVRALSAAPAGVPIMHAIASRPPLTACTSIKHVLVLHAAVLQAKSGKRMRGHLALGM